MKASTIAVPRRFYTFTWFTAVLLSAAFLLSAWSEVNSLPKHWSIPFLNINASALPFVTYGKPKCPLNIWILESGGSHDEVTAALIHAFGSQRNSKLRLFLKGLRYEMEQIISNFTLPEPFPAIEPFGAFAAAVEQSPPPQVLVSTTCEVDLGRAMGPLAQLLDQGRTHLFCVMHHGDRWVRGKSVIVAKEWGKYGRIDFVGLSQHTVNFLQNRTRSRWNMDAAVPMRVFPPVFPVASSAPDAVGELSLAIQGDYASGRRNYTRIFRQLGSMIKNAGDSSNGIRTGKISMHILGHGRPPAVPANVKDSIVFDQGLSYPDYYALLGRAFSIIPAFASRGYFDTKASSSVPAALIAGTPLVATEELLAAYTYLPQDAVWMSNKGEGEMEAIERVLGEEEEYVKKSNVARAACARLIRENTEHVKEWIVEALRDMYGMAKASNRGLALHA
ncbi:hypothetical protein GQ53DRAFT_855542 [Thozetella sp. PMI_491]|nr:hypothetical protein GQ53DRAFT_855542 [Thozetella sp. PMI_491]